MKSKKPAAYPSKTQINLVMRSDSAGGASKALIIVIVLLLVVAAVVKFGVVDRLNLVSEAERRAAEAETALSSLQDYTKDYDTLMETYAMYSNAGFTEEELSLVDRMEILTLVEEELMEAAQVTDLTAVDNTLAIKVSGISLEQLSDLLGSLNANEWVSFVVVTSVDSGESGGTDASVTMTIFLTSPEGGVQP